MQQGFTLSVRQCCIFFSCTDSAELKSRPWYLSLQQHGLFCFLHSSDWTSTCPFWVHILLNLNFPLKEKKMKLFGINLWHRTKFFPPCVGKTSETWWPPGHTHSFCLSPTASAREGCRRTSRLALHRVSVPPVCRACECESVCGCLCAKLWQRLQAQQVLQQPQRSYITHLKWPANSSALSGTCSPAPLCHFLCLLLLATITLKHSHHVAQVVCNKSCSLAE